MERPGSHDAYDRLRSYALLHGGPAFIHQHVVDAFAAQTADARTKPIALMFALVGLYLRTQKQVSGLEIQDIHVSLACRKQSWPVIPLPAERGALTVVDVIEAPEGREREAAIEAWCSEVWAAYAGSHAVVIDFLQQNGIP
jgi:hypothetical protein